MDNNSIISQLEEKLIAQERMATLGESVAGVAHEINNPLGLSITTGSILVNDIEKLKSKIDDESLSKDDLLAFINGSSMQAEILLRNLQKASSMMKMFQHAAVERSNLSLHSFDLDSFFENLILTLNPEYKSSSLTPLLNIEKGLIIKTNSAKLGQVITNLILNSVRHAFKGIANPKITINAKRHKGKCIIELSDNGIGMEEDILTHVFDLFFTTKKGNGGTGIGMNMVKTLVEDHLQGEISIKSSPNQGCVTTIKLPLIMKSD